MGRRRRRVIRVFRRTLPKVFSCPRCGMIAVRISRRESEGVSIACGSCGLNYQSPPKGKKEPIDIYNEFVDNFMSGRVG